MPALLSDVEIASLLRERKQLPSDYRERIQPRPKRGHKERELDLQGANGTEFRLIIRQGIVNPLDFSVILAYLPAGTNRLFRLTRYNSRTHEHTNQLEGQTFFGWHIHKATERYQNSGFREDAFAEPTDRFSDLAGALECVIVDCGLARPSGDQGTLF